MALYLITSIIRRIVTFKYNYVIYFKVIFITSKYDIYTVNKMIIIDRLLENDKRKQVFVCEGEEAKTLKSVLEEAGY